MRLRTDCARALSDPVFGRRSIACSFNHSINYSNKDCMNIHLTMVPIVSLLAGILILAMPKLLNYIIAIYLIAIGLFGLFGSRLH